MWGDAVQCLVGFGTGASQSGVLYPVFHALIPQQQVLVSPGGSARLGDTRGVCQPLHHDDEPARPIAGAASSWFSPAAADTCPGHADTEIVLRYTTGVVTRCPPY